MNLVPGLSLIVYVAMTSLVTSEDFTATFSMNGVKQVYIIFTPNGAETTVNVVGNIPNTYTSIKIMSFPVIFGRTVNAATACSNLGTTAIELFDSTEAATKVFEFSESTFLFRSVAISGTDQPTICANILGNAATKTYRAKFVGAVAGEVWYRTSSYGASLFGDVYATSSSLTGAKKLNIYSTKVGVNFSDRCSNLGNALSQLTDNISVPTTAADEGRFTAFTSTAGASANSLAFVSADGSMVACSNLVKVVTESAIATFNWDNVFGNIKFSQSSPFDQTDVQINLSGLNNEAEGFHVHKYPVSQRISSTEDRCGPKLVSGHFNPYGIIVANSPTAGSGTDDQYEIGDLSGKYGVLEGYGWAQAHIDWNLPMFGVNSIVGRSIVIHKVGGSRWVCSTIEPDYDITVAVTTFKSPIFGSIYMTQRSSDAEADTSVFIELSSQMMTSSANHNWHVHETMLGADQLTDENRCSSAGGHYNPFSVEMGDSYSSCTSSTPYRCELGDSSSKMGTVDVGNMARTEGSKFFSTDVYLPLSGPFSVMERSVVVHVMEKGAARFACANLLPLHPLQVSTQAWKGGASISGGLEIMQKSEFMRSKTTSNLSGLSSNAKNYHIHETTITSGAADGDACQVASVGGHYNPFNVVIDDGFSNDKYEVGDLSGKYRPIIGDVLTLNSYDTNLPLFTGLSTADKSIVLHATSDGSRWSCADLLLQPSTTSGGYVAKATVTFNSVVKGTITLRQVVYEDWSASPTGIQLNVKMPVETSTSLQHNWHIHIDPVTSEGNCGIAQGHYNPYSAPIGESFYKTECKVGNPLMCEVGDLSNKHAKYDIGGGKKTFVDVDVPLHTPFTVLGRSIVFHVADGGADRYACANIVPDENVYTMSFPDSTTFDGKTFMSTLAASLGVVESRVVVVHNTDIPVTKNGCSRIMVYIVGGTSKSSNLLAGTLSNMADYATSELCTNQEGAVVLGETSDEVYAKDTCSPACRQMVEYGLCHYHGDQFAQLTDCLPKCCVCEDSHLCPHYLIQVFGCKFEGYLCKKSCGLCKTNERSAA